MLTFTIQDTGIFSIYEKINDHIKADILLHVGLQRMTDITIFKPRKNCSKVKKDVGSIQIVAYSS